MIIIVAIKFPLDAKKNNFKGYQCDASFYTLSLQVVASDKKTS
jgi:hypothetical protein